MEIRNIIQPSISNSTSPAGNLSPLVQGQLLKATVVERLSAQTLLFKSGERLFEATSRGANSLKPGDAISLQVEKTGQPVLLKIVNNRQTIKQELQQTLLRESLPKQQDLRLLTTLFNQFKRSAGSVTQSLPLPLVKQLQQILKSFPTAQQIMTSQGIQTAVKESGLFLEARLMQHTNQRSQIPLANTSPFAVAQDFKANLLKLKKSLSELPQKPMSTHQFQDAKTNSAASSGMTQSAAGMINKQAATERANLSDKPMTISRNNIEHVTKLDSSQLLKQLEASLARVENNQARSIATESNPLPHWRFEIPVTDNNDVDLLTLDLHKEHSDREVASDKNWSINIEVDFQDIGRFCARLSCQQDDMRVLLWTEHAALSGMIDKHLDQLRKQLCMHGINNAVIELQNHEPASAESVMPNNLINISL